MTSTRHHSYRDEQQYFRSGALMVKRERDADRYPVQRLLHGLAARID